MNNNNLKESVEHGTIQIPLAIYSHNRVEEDLSVPHHWHEEIELVYIEKGKFDLEINTEKINAKENTFYFINSKELHYMKCTSPLIEHAIVFDLKLLSFEMFDYSQNKIINPLLKKELKFPCTIEGDTEYGKVIHHEFIQIMEAYSLRKSGWYITIKASLLKILAILVDYNLLVQKSSTTPKNNNYKVKLIKKVLTYIHNNYKNKIYIKNLADEINMNEQYFCRFFKNIIGKTPIDYLNEYRIEKAAEQLQESEMKIVDVCLECGYDNVGYFIKKFKKYKGYTPSEYKKNVLSLK